MHLRSTSSVITSKIRENIGQLDPAEVSEKSTDYAKWTPATRLFRATGAKVGSARITQVNLFLDVRRLLFSIIALSVHTLLVPLLKRAKRVT